MQYCRGSFLFGGLALFITDVTGNGSPEFNPSDLLKTVEEPGPESIVAVPSVPSAGQVPDHYYNYEHSICNKASDTYTCQLLWKGALSDVTPYCQAPVRKLILLQEK